MFLQLLDRVLPFLKKNKEQGKVCPNGHVIHPDEGRFCATCGLRVDAPLQPHDESGHGTVTPPHSRRTALFSTVAS